MASEAGVTIVIRPYEARDRAAVRRISYETADGGRAGRSIHSDGEFIADLLTRYYTDFEPESTLVTTGYESKNASPRSSTRARSEILTPNQPVGGCTITVRVL